MPGISSSGNGLLTHTISKKTRARRLNLPEIQEGLAGKKRSSSLMNLCKGGYKMVSLRKI